MKTKGSSASGEIRTLLRRGLDGVQRVELLLVGQCVSGSTTTSGDIEIEPLSRTLVPFSSPIVRARSPIRYPIIIATHVKNIVRK